MAKSDGEKNESLIARFQKVFEHDKHIFINPLMPSLGVGATTGTAGVLVGYIAGLAASSTPRLFATLMGVQWFGLGSIFWYFRSTLVLADAAGHPTRKQELQYSGVAGGLSGALNGAIRSRSNILPAMIMCGLFGLAGQKAVHIAFRQSNLEKDERSLLQKLASSKWVPIKPLDDEEYEKMLGEKLLRTETSIAMIDDQISALRQSKSQNGK